MSSPRSAFLAASLLTIGCGSAAFDPYQAYERPIAPDADEQETVAPAQLRLSVSGDPAVLEATEGRLKAVAERFGGAVTVVDPAELRPQLTYALSVGGPFAGRDVARVSRYEVRFKARIKSTLAPMRAVWVVGNKTTFDVGGAGGAARLVEEGLDTFRLVLTPKGDPSPLVVDGAPQRRGKGWTLTGAPPLKLYERRGKRWVRIRISAPRQTVVPAPPTRVRVFTIKGLSEGLDAFLAALLQENARSEDDVLSLSLDATELWLNAERRPAPSED